MLVEMLGWAAAIYGAFVVMPQLARVARSRTTAGISLLAWQSSWSGTLSWGAYGLMFGYPNIWIPNVLLSVSATWMLIMISKDKRLLMRDRFLIFLFPALVSLLTAALSILVGPLAFAAVVFIPAAISQLMQLRNLALAPDISAVSMPFMAMGVIGQLLWFCWGMVADDISNQVVAGCLAVL